MLLRAIVLYVQSIYLSHKFLIKPFRNVCKTVVSTAVAAAKAASVRREPHQPSASFIPAKVSHNAQHAYERSLHIVCTMQLCFSNLTAMFTDDYLIKSIIRTKYDTYTLNVIYLSAALFK